jgi:Ca-activated chloride channel homolog
MIVIILLILCLNSLFAEQLEYEVEVQVVDLQVSVADADGDYVTELTPEDFQVFEDGVPQTVLDLELERQPFSIGVLLDTSSSMQSEFQSMFRAAGDFLQSLMPRDEYFVMTFDDRVIVRNQMEYASMSRNPDLSRLRFGEKTRLFEGVISGIERLKTARYPRRALFLISDGVNSSGDFGLGDAIREAQKSKTLIYSLIIRKGATDLYVLGTLSRMSGGTFFVMDDEFPRLKSAYEKIAFDLAHRFTLYYQSISDYNKQKKPAIEILMKKPDWIVRYQRAYFPVD